MVLPYSFAVKLKENLTDKDLHFIDFQGGHEIPPQTLFELSRLLKDLT